MARPVPQYTITSTVPQYTIASLVSQCTMSRPVPEYTIASLVPQYTMASLVHSVPWLGHYHSVSHPPLKTWLPPPVFLPDPCPPLTQGSPQSLHQAVLPGGLW